MTDLPSLIGHADIEHVRELDFQSYLARSGWELTRHQDRVNVWSQTIDRRMLQVVLPLDTEAPDFGELLYQAIRVIAFAARKSVFEVIADVEYGGADVVSVRLVANAPSGQAPLTVAQAAVTALKSFVIGAAAGLDAVTAVLPSRRPRAERYANQVRLSTSSGSFVLTLALPLFEQAPTVDPNAIQTAMTDSVEVEATPYGREVAHRMRSVATHAVELTTAIAEGREDLTVFEADPALSGNATELEGLAGLGGRGNRPYEIRFVASPIVAQRSVDPTVISVPDQSQETFARAAKLLRERKPKDDITVVGKVVRLAREGGFGPGEIVLRGLEPAAQNEHRYRIALSEDQYRLAITAHERSAEVAARGSLSIRGNFLIIYPLRWFSVQEAIPETT